MLPLRQRLRAESAFTIVEVMVASIVLFVGLLGVLAMVDFMNLETGRNRDREAANNLARDLTETAKKVPYAAVTPTAIASTLQAQSGLADADAIKPGWQVERRGVSFTITSTVCVVDDPSDGLGVRDPATTWCSQAGGTADATPSDYKRFTVSLAAEGGTSVAMSTFVADTRSGTDGSSGGGGGGDEAPDRFAIYLDVDSCTGCSETAWMSGGHIAPCKTFTSVVGAGKCLPTYNGAAGPNFSGNQITSIPVETIFPKSVATVKYFISKPQMMWEPIGTYNGNWPEALLGNGTQIASAPKTFSYTWNPASTYPNQDPDGYYLIKARGYDSSGAQVGNVMVLSFWLNRFVPDLGYFKIKASRNQLFCTGTCPNASATAEVQWTPDLTGATRRDLDIWQFKAYRSGLASAVCTIGPEANWSTGEFGFQYSAFGHVRSASSCRDTASPATPTSGTVTYTLGTVNWGPDGFATAEGGNVQTSGNVNSINSTPTASCGNNCRGRPSQPASFSVGWTTVNGVKVPFFQWTDPTSVTIAPSPRFDSSAAPDCVQSYRIYRTPNTQTTQPTVSQRMYRTSGGVAGCATVNKVINHTAPRQDWVSSSARYWITAVDTTGNESIARMNAANLTAP